jgi:hypothetical protein
MTWEESFPTLFWFPHLVHFVAGFRHPDEDGPSDEEIAAEDISQSSPEHRQAILEEGRAVLAAPEFPWDELRWLANRGFDDGRETREWLARMLGVVEATVPGPLVPKYPKWTSRHYLLYFLGAGFPATDSGGAADEAAAERMIATSGPLYREAILQQGRGVLAERDCLWEDVRSLTRRPFRSEIEARDWLNRILRVVEATAPAPAPSEA